MIPNIITRTNFENTPGYQSLTAWQKKVIHTSLRLDTRYQKTKGPKRRYYRTTEKYYELLNCHLSIYSLEIQKFPGFLNNDDIPSHFFEASYSSNRILTDLEINKFASHLVFPAVIHISHAPCFTGSHDTVSHTLLALGYEQEKLVAWEKRGYCGEFRIVSAEELITDRYNLYWGSRPLRYLE